MPHTIDCLTLSLRLDDLGRACSLRHLPTGLELLAAGSPPTGLWELGLSKPASYDDPLPPVSPPAAEYEGHEWFANRDEYDAALTLDAAASRPAVARHGDTLTLAWRLPVPGGEASVTLRILGGERHELSFTAAVVVPPEWTVSWLVAPRLRGLGDPADPAADALLYPKNFGVLRHNPLESMSAFLGQYPGGGQWGQFLAWLHGEAGLYAAVLDPDCNLTGLEAQYVEGGLPAPVPLERWFLRKGEAPWLNGEALPLAARVAAGRQPAMQLSVRHWPAQGNAWEMPYPVVLRGFRGSWYEAAAIHRGWALLQRWCRRGPLADRPTLPACAGLDLWFTRYGFPPWEWTPGDASATQAAMHRLVDYFQMPCGLHWYHWHAFNWHSSYPAHAPVVEGFAEAVKDLQARGVVIMPYCQGRLLYRDRPALETERSHAAIAANGQPYMEMYTKQDDWPLALCPHDPWARQQWIEAARLLWRQYGVEGVYYDQLAAMMPSRCHHRGHGHALGGGNQHWAGYERLLSDLEPMKQEDPRRFLSSECLCDAYLDRLDVYLAFVPPLEDYVPLWPAVYGGYTMVLGRATPEPIMADLQLFVLCHGEQLLFGGQLGWFDERILTYPDSAAFLRDAARLRSRIRDFVQLGTLEAPLAATVEGTPLDLELPIALTGELHPIRLQRPPVQHTVWRGPDGRRLILLLNESREPAAFVTRELPGQWLLWRQGAGEAETVTAPGRLEVPPLQALALVELPRE